MRRLVLIPTSKDLHHEAAARKATARAHASQECGDDAKLRTVMKKMKADSLHQLSEAPTLNAVASHAGHCKERNALCFASTANPSSSRYVALPKRPPCHYLFTLLA